MEPKHAAKTMYYWPYIDVVLWLNKILFEYSITQRGGSYNKNNPDDGRGHHINMSVPYKGWLCDNFGNIVWCLWLEWCMYLYIRVTLCWGYLNVLWLFHLVCILYCGCFNLFCNVWICVCVGVLVIRVLEFAVFCSVCTVFLYGFVYVYLFLFLC